VWEAAHTLKPDVVVETGVARGLTSALILDALEENGKGHLYSIDLPPLHELTIGEAVTDSLTHRWTYLRGSSRELLPSLAGALKPVDIFIHDSLHTYWTMRFEFSWALEHLRPGGMLISDDIESNAAFDKLDGTAYHHSEKDGLFGVYAKPS
jgi:predicted O-methyltransferase YrrM